MQSTRRNFYSQGQSTAARVGPTKQYGPPDDSNERLHFFRVIKQGPVCRNDFLKGVGRSEGRQMTQVGRLVHQLEKEGYIFRHFKSDYCYAAGNKCRFIHYELIAEPQVPGHPAPKAVPAQRKGWKASPFFFGRRATQEPPRTTQSPAQQCLGLFDAMTASSANNNFVQSELGKLNW